MIQLLCDYKIRFKREAGSRYNFFDRAGWMIGICILLFVIPSVAQHGNQKRISPLEKGFISPPDTIQTSVYWYWLSDNISKEGVIRDLEAMKRVGINRAFIGNIGLDEKDIPYGKVKVFSDEWWNILHTALKKATELNIEIGIFNSPGWSQSGGPWVRPEQAMRYLSSTTLLVQGGTEIQQQLPAPEGLQDVKVLAFPAPAGYGTSIRDKRPIVSMNPSGENPSILFDRATDRAIDIPSGGEVRIDVQVADPYTVREMTIYPAQRNMKIEVELQAMYNGDFQTVKKFVADRSNNELHVGFQPFAPVIESFAAVTSNAFRIIITHQSGKAGVTEIELSGTPRVERYVEKTLAKMYPTPLPYWKEYQWPVQPVVDDTRFVIDPSRVLDISSFMNEDGILTWQVPPGEWVVMRTGMLPTGVKNSPASEEATGLEIDKMSSRHAAAHFDAFMGEIIRRVPAEDRKTWKVVVQDSYEMGGQNWTDDFIRRFTVKFGYDPLPYVPCMFGNVVGSQDQSDRFLWDLRRFVADNVAYEYVGGLRDISHRYGLRTWLENYGHWGFPGEFLQYGGQSDEIGGEFWNEGDLGNIENRAASSSAHIYGKKKVFAESFTAGGKPYVRYPALMKQRGDRFFTEGINSSLLHVYIHQPYETRRPGMNAWFGVEFNRFNTWFEDMDLFTAYLKRCNYMLQQGNYVADVAYFIGEDAPKMTGVTDPPLPKGYSFDYINAEVIENRLTVKDGRFVLPEGISYGILVLPKLETMRPAVLRKLMELVGQGGVVLGPKPKRSPSLQDFGKADREVQEMSQLLWGKIDGISEKINRYGKGLVMDGMDMQEALDRIGLIPDFKSSEVDPVLYTHRTTDEGEIYFISNQSNEAIHIKPAFRVTGKKPEYWDALSGAVRELPVFTVEGQTTVVPLTLPANGSVFVMFRKKGRARRNNNPEGNFPAPINRITISSPWEVKFDEKMRGPVKPVTFNSLTDWTDHANDSIKYYSGSAWYTNRFVLDKLNRKERVQLNLGKVIALAKVKINEKDVGGVWTSPYTVDITDAVKQGENVVEIKVVNTWVNRLIGDMHLPQHERKTWTVVNPYQADSPLEPSGLIGPVSVEFVRYGK